MGGQKRKKARANARAFLQLEIAVLVDREAVEVACAAGADQRFLGAAGAQMRRVPGNVAAAGAVGMAEHRGAGAVAGPVAAGAILAGRERTAFHGRTGQDVVRVRVVADAIVGRVFFAYGVALGHHVAHASEFRGVPMQFREVGGDLRAGGVEPGAVADAIAGVDGLAARRVTLSAKVGTPGSAAETDRSGQPLARRVRAGEAAEVARGAGRAGDEERDLWATRRRRGGGR